MNKKLVTVGKAALSTVMVSSFACSMFTTNIYAQETEMKPDDAITNEETTNSSVGEPEIFNVIDYSKMDRIIGEIDDSLREESFYTPDSWKEFKAVYEKAKSARNDTSLTQENVDAIADELFQAFLSLDRAPTPDLDITYAVNKTDHNTVWVSLVSSKRLEKPESTPYGDVNEDIWLFYAGHGKYFYDKEFTQNGTYVINCVATDGATKDITIEVTGLQDLDYTKMYEVLNYIGARLEDKSHYTEESWAKFEPLYEQVKNAWKDGSLTQDDLDKLTEDLKNAYSELETVITDLIINVSMIKTEWNTVIVTMESNILLMKPDASNIGVANPYRWIHYDKDGLHYYEKEFTQNGTYTERCEDTLGNTKEITFTIDLLSSVQNEAPVINATDKTITVGEKFDPRKDVTAVDKEDGDITSLMTIKTNVDVRKVGEYQVTYTVTDSQKATTSKTIKVTVKEKAADAGKDKDKSQDKTKDKDKKKVNTSVGLSTGLYVGAAGISALGMAVLKMLKRHDE